MVRVATRLGIFIKSSAWNDTHASATDPEARLYRRSKGTPAKLCHLGHVVSENGHGQVVDACVTQANGTAERSAAIEMLQEPSGPRSSERSPREAMLELRAKNILQSLLGRGDACSRRFAGGSKHDGFIGSICRLCC